LIEIFNDGLQPYGDWKNDEVIDNVTSKDARPLRPQNMPISIYQLAQQCWVRDATKRLTFKEISTIIEKEMQLTESVVEKERQASVLNLKSETKDYVNKKIENEPEENSYSLAPNLVEKK